MSQKMTELIHKATEEKNQWTENPHLYVDTKVLGAGRLVIGKRVHQGRGSQIVSEWYELFFVKENGEVIDLSNVDPMADLVKCHKCHDEHREENSLIAGKVVCHMCQHTKDDEIRKHVKEVREAETKALADFTTQLHAKREKPVAV